MTTTPPNTTTRPKEVSELAPPLASTSASSNAHSPPEFVVTPATPNTPAHPQNSVSQSLPIPAEVKGDPVGETAGDNQRSGEEKTTEVVPVTEKKVAATEKPATTAAASSSNAAAKSTSNARQTSRSAPKKKKRSGLSGFLLRLGCLSADEFEDPEPKKGTVPAKATTSKTATPTSPTPKTASTPDVKTTTSPAVGETKAVQPKVVGTTGPVLLETEGEKDRGLVGDVKPGEEVVVAPHEPTIAPDDETAGLTSSAVQAPGSGSALLTTPVRPSNSRRQSESSPSSASPENERTETSGGYSGISESEIPDESSGAAAAGVEEEYGLEDEYDDEEDRLIAQGGIGIPVDEHGNPAPLLPVMDKAHSGRKCLVLDLDETLLHSSFKMLPSADYIVPVEIESQTHNVYVIKRPGVDHFLTEMGKIYEVVIFTASLSKYADPVLDMLDTGRVVRHRLFRESCYNHKGNYVKDLSQLGREMEDCIIIDNSPASYIFHPNNAVPVSTWFNDPHDTELTDLCPFLTDLATVDDIRGVLDGNI